MKRIITLIFVAVLVASCTQDFKSIEPIKVEGVDLKIDSAKWEPALIQVSDSHLKIYNKDKEIRKVRTWDVADTFLVGFLLGMFVVLIICVFANMVRETE